MKTTSLLLCFFSIALGCALPTEPTAGAHTDDEGSLGFDTAAATRAGGFSDVSDHWAGPVIQFLGRHGVERRDERIILVRAGDDAMTPVLRGFGDGTFRPNERLTREQLAALILALRPDLEVEHWQACDGHVAEQTLDAELVDAGSIGAWARTQVCVAVRGGLLEGKRLPGTEERRFDPAAPLTKSELLAVLRRVFDWHQPIFPGADESNALHVDCSRVADARWQAYCDWIEPDVTLSTSSNGWDWALVDFAHHHYVIAVDEDRYAPDLSKDAVTRGEVAAAIYLSLSHAFAFEQLKSLPPEPGAATNPFDDDDGCVPLSVARRVVGADVHFGDVEDRGNRDQGHDSLATNLCEL
ncbi:MAG: S-layer homology domain-containing protein [Myxococcales bacterium]|nr:S-layer homology domain-containing protein [Myxococcales bacterium]